MRLIDADALKAWFFRPYSNEETYSNIDIGLRIDIAPTVDPVKHGYWIAHAMSIKDVPTEACSECGEWSYGCDESYCPKCGAKMDGVKE